MKLKTKRATISVIAFVIMYIVFLSAFMEVAIVDDAKLKRPPNRVLNVKL